MLYRSVKSCASDYRMRSDTFHVDLVMTGPLGDSHRTVWAVREVHYLTEYNLESVSTNCYSSSRENEKEKK